MLYEKILESNEGKFIELNICGFRSEHNMQDHIFSVKLITMEIAESTSKVYIAIMEYNEKNIIYIEK